MLALVSVLSYTPGRTFYRRLSKQSARLVGVRTVFKRFFQRLVATGSDAQEVILLIHILDYSHYISQLTFHWLLFIIST